MKILVMSDSHGAKKLLLRVFEHVGPDLTLHLGDHDKDALDLQEAYPDAYIRTVRGNCDRSSSGLDIDVFTASGLCIFMTHGHLNSVKSGIAAFTESARAHGADIALFGHTHNKYYAASGGMSIINPGSIGTGDKNFAVLIIEHGEAKCDFISAKKL